jgi:hypothetical protein
MQRARWWKGAGTGGPLRQYSVLGPRYSVRRRLGFGPWASAGSRAKSKPGGPIRLGPPDGRRRPSPHDPSPRAPFLRRVTRGELPEAARNWLRVQGSLRLRSGQALRCGCSLRSSRKEQSSFRMTGLKQNPAARCEWAGGRAEGMSPLLYLSFLLQHWDCWWT